MRSNTVRQVKILIAGGFGVGKTTAVGALSEIRPVHTEEVLTAASIPTDPLTGVEDKSSTTVALDFGRITMADLDFVVYLFGTPGQERFWFMWDELATGVLGAVVLVDTRRLADSFPAVDFFEDRRIGFVVAVNEFPDTARYDAEEVRHALQLGPDVPIIHCDARERESMKWVLITLLTHLIDRAKRRRAQALP